MQEKWMERMGLKITQTTLSQRDYGIDDSGITLRLPLNAKVVLICHFDKFCFT